MKALADILVSVCVRELRTAHAGDKKARRTAIRRAKIMEQGNDNREIEETHTVQKLR